MRNRYLAIFFISCVAVFLASWVSAQDMKDINEQIKELEKKIQRAADVEAIKRIMTKTQYVMDVEGTGAVKKTPGACFGQNDGYIYGAFIKRSKEREQQMQGPTEGAPGGGEGHGVGFHALSTPVIEIAEDGQTAKAVWYTPGPLGGGSWIYELYACDFVKEDGEWKSWHRTVATDFMTSIEKSWTDTLYTKAGQDEEARIGGILDKTKGGEFKPAKTDEGKQTPVPNAGAQSFKDIKMVAYQSWTRETLPQYKPKPPVPYKTFSETFSYCPPMPKNLEEELWREGLMFESVSGTP